MKTAAAVVVDSYAWIEIFIGSVQGEKAMEAIQKAEEAYTPDIVLAEIARKYMREGAKENLIQQRLKTIEETTEVTPIDTQTAIESAKCHLQLTEKAKKENLTAPSLFDAIILATAKTLNAKLITGDQHFKGLNQTLWIGET
ncbi:MAG: PIN domain-containing protein [Candidatus Bathyarchaeota archaeon]|nr:PIN domain-containing protein [Candidatus Bathyarchaeota archaeon]MDW8040723.1 PIN domain-containing protein [Nitrososphaerota archaeon]